jgi:unsaturated rhamnogalacturonyl hydrolase
MNKIIFGFILIFSLSSCAGKKQVEETGYAVKMADSEMKRNPESWMLDFSKEPKWNYTQGLVLKAIYEVGEKTKDKKYFDYVKSYVDTMIAPGGKIRGYKPTEYNIDRINSGKILFPLYTKTRKKLLMISSGKILFPLYTKGKNTVYKLAIDTLRTQMLTHPRTSEGGFWHKKIYEHQMWLDGIYMASPFLAQYAAEFNEPALFDDVANQILLIAKHTYNPATGLYYHGWDESKTQKWANPETGQSPEFWSRSIGWYMMAMVDVLDFLPENHPQREAIIDVLKNLSAALEKYQDKETELWYQVTDKGGAPGNYLESSASAMFIYTWAKGAQKGYLASSYLEKAYSAYDNYIRQFIRTNEDGTISVTSGCAVAGLGGNPYRDGSYEYYISEPVRDNDPKATGPFILASLLLNK